MDFVTGMRFCLLWKKVGDFCYDFYSDKVFLDHHYNIDELNNRITDDYKKCRLGNPKLIVDVTHCDEMDRVDEFKKHFINVNTYDDALIK